MDPSERLPKKARRHSRDPGARTKDNAKEVVTRNKEKEKKDEGKAGKPMWKLGARPKEREPRRYGRR